MKKFLISILIIILMSVAMIGSVYAAQLQTTIDITASTTEVSADDKVVFTFALKNIANAKDNSIGAIEGVVTYDTNFYELVTGVTNTTFTAGGESGEKFNVLCGGAKEGETVAILTLKVKDNPTGNGIVKFTELAASDGDVDRGDEAIATTADKQIEVKLKSSTPTEPTEPTDPSKPTAPEKPSIPTTPSDNEKPSINQPTTDGVTVSVGGQNNDSTIANTAIPKAGVNAILIIAVLVASVVAIIIYKKNQKFRDIK